MPTSEHKFSIEELLTALIRDKGVHEGFWALNVEFSATGATVKPQDNPARSLPGLIVSMNSATLIPAASAAAGAVDAAVVNPRKSVESAKPVRAKRQPARTLQ